MTVQATQIDQIKALHAAGKLDPEIVQATGLSVSTVKRYRKKLGLTTNCETARRGTLGEQMTARQAAALGLRVEWRTVEGEKHDLVIEGQRVDAKAAMRQADGAWRFRLQATRPSFYGKYQYDKNYAQDCELLVLICLYPDGQPADFYLIGSAHAPHEVRIKLGGNYTDFKDAWDVFEVTGAPLLA